MYNPGTFYEIWLKKKKLNKTLPSLQQKHGIEGEFKINNSYTQEAYTDLKTKDIYLPLNYLETDINNIMMEHELLHHKVTKDVVLVRDSFTEENAQKVKQAINIVDDIIINELVGVNKIKKVNRALDTLSKQQNPNQKNSGLNLNIFISLNQDERLRVIKECQESGFLKKDKDAEEIVEILRKTLLNKVRKTGEFLPIQKDQNFREFVLCIEDPKKCPISIPGDGPTDYVPDREDKIDEQLYKKCKKLFENLIAMTIEQNKKERWYGKRMNRRVIELDDDTKPPFIQKKIIKNIHRPNILIVMDLSGSMEDEPIERAKAFTLALFETAQKVADITIVGSNATVGKIFLNSIKDIRTAVAQNNDDFDRGWEKLGIENNSYDIITIITDLNIDSDELDGLKNFVERNKKQHTRVYTLAVESGRQREKEVMKSISKIVDVTDTDEYVNFAKKLVNNFN